MNNQPFGDDWADMWGNNEDGGRGYPDSDSVSTPSPPSQDPKNNDGRTECYRCYGSSLVQKAGLNETYTICMDCGA